MEGTTPDHAHQPPQSRPVLFISHLTEDRQVADVLTHFVRAHSGGLVQVFQTSTDIAQSGRHQRQHLMQALWDAIVIILVYTDSTKDWSYCIWECGVAAQPPNPARLVILTDSNKVPTAFANETRFRARELFDVQHFVNVLLTSAEYFPRYPQALTHDVQPNGPEILLAADELHTRLSAALDRGHAVFISYRRQDTAPYARLLREELSKRFGESRVFMDVDSISGGLDFQQEIKRVISVCKLLIALIGPQWITITGAEGQRRLDDPNDLVRLEIETALAKEIPVIPVLVDNTSMPRAQQLPHSLAPLTRRNALELTYDRYSDDISRVLKVVRSFIGRTATAPPSAP
jgi:hypothetical protein